MVSMREMGEHSLEGVQRRLRYLGGILLKFYYIVSAGGTFGLRADRSDIDVIGQHSIANRKCI